LDQGFSGDLEIWPWHHPYPHGSFHPKRLARLAYPWGGD
jgi:hypothetical protein